MQLDHLPFLEVLIAACPSFTSYWEEIASIYGGLPLDRVAEEDVLGEFARHTLELHQDSEEQAFPRIASVLYSLHENGTSADRERVAFLLNMIGYDWSWNGVDPEPFFRHVPDGLRHLCTTEEPPWIDGEDASFVKTPAI